MQVNMKEQEVYNATKTFLWHTCEVSLFSGSKQRAKRHLAMSSHLAKKTKAGVAITFMDGVNKGGKIGEYKTARTALVPPGCRDDT